MPHSCSVDLFKLSSVGVRKDITRNSVEIGGCPAAVTGDEPFKLTVSPVAKREEKGEMDPGARRLTNMQ